MKTRILKIFILALTLLATGRPSWAQPVTLGCGSTFTDPGGPTANYPDNANVTYLICPGNPGDRVTVTFSSFITASGDKLFAYNGQSTTSPSLGTFSGNLTTNLPGGINGIKSTDTSGCLTFKFTSNASVNAAGWVASVSCAPQCMPATGLTASNLTPHSADIAWAGPSVGITPATWFYEVRTSGNPGSGATGLISSAMVSAPTSAASLSGLSGNTLYYVYIRTYCGGTDTSIWSAPLTFTTLPGCGSTFTDPGGLLGNYANNLDTTYVICPDAPGDVASVNFITFETQLNQDKLFVYDGSSVASPLIGSYSGMGLLNAPGAGEVIANNPGGCLTFRFVTNATGVASGWLANVSCGLPQNCAGPTGLHFTNLTPTSATIQWLAPGFSTPVGYEYEVRSSGLPGSGPIGLALSGSVAAPLLSADLSGLTPNTVYAVYMRSNCGSGTFSNWSVLPLQLITPPVCGSTFTDPGGPSANYPDNANVTYLICPDDPAEGVTVTFSGFITASGDKLFVYNGPNITSPSLGAFSGNLSANLPGGVNGIKATNSSGCLTFKFTSTASINAAGWVAAVSCAPHCKPPASISLSNIADNGVQLHWTAPALGSMPAGYVYEVRSIGNGGSGATGLAASGVTAAGSTSALVNGLAGNTLYRVFVRTNCGGTDTSLWTGPVTFTTLPGCGSTFNDPGGPLANYTNNLDSTFVLCPDAAGEAVKVNFISFETQPNLDKLLVYEGNSVAAPLIGEYSGIGLLNAPGAGEVIANNASGCLTFRFTTNVSTVYAGWLADVTCVPLPTCVGPTGLSFSDLTTGSATLHWLPPSFTTPVHYEYEVRSSGLPGSGGAGLAASGAVPASVLSANLSGLPANTVFYVYLRSDCGSGDYSGWSSEPLLLITPPVCGSTFTDPGGVAGNYPDNLNVTYKICPENPGDGVTVTFSSFITASGDKLMAYNGPSITAPLLGTYTGNLTANLPGGTAGVKSTDTSGCLTFKFISNATINNIGWEATVSCAPHCLPVSGMALSNITHNGVQLNWTSPGIGSSPAAYIYEVRTSGNPGSGATGLVQTNMVNVPASAATIAGLSGNTLYRVYLRTFCGGTDTSMWSGPLTFTTLPGCGSTFTDPGGLLGNYANNLDTTYVICPDSSGDVVSVNFITFETQLNQDKLFVYDGTTASAPLIGAFSGIGLLNAPGAGEVIANNLSGCLTFKFTSNASGTYSGWLANVNCGLPQSCVGPTGMSFTNLMPNSATLHWLAPAFSTPLNYEYEVRSSGLPGSGATGLATSGSVAVPALSVALTGLSSNTLYSVYMRSDCGSGEFSNWSVLPLHISTPPVCGSTFTDPGGPTANYPDNANVTYLICPENPGDTVFVTFSSFITASGDKLMAYNGPSVTSPLMGTYSGNLTMNLPGGPTGLKSTHASGCLTFKFTSNAAVNAAGWVATVSCHTPVPCSGMPTAGVISAAAPFTYCDSAPAKTFTLSGYTSGMPGISIGWQVSDDGVSFADIDGATATSYTTPAESATRYYRAKVSCAASGLSDYSNVITIVAATPVAITTQPENTGVCMGQSASLSVSAVGAAAYQWYKDGVAISGATDATYTIVSASAADVGSYTVIVNGVAPCANAISNSALVFINVIDAAISYSGTPYCGNAGMAYVAHTGSGGGFYSGEPGLSLDGATGTIDLAASIPDNYTVTYTIPAGSGCAEFSTTAFVTIVAAPVITTQPAPVFACAGDPVMLQVSAEGAASYQWYQDGAPIIGAVDSFYAVESAAVADAGNYSVVIGGCTVSNPAWVSVVPTINVYLGPDVTLCPGAVLTLDAGNPGAAYGWSTGATSQTITVDAPGTYIVTASLGNCWDTDAITVNEPGVPVAGVIDVSGSTPNFTFSATGSSGASTLNWNFGDGHTGVGDVMTYTYAAPGVYTVTLIAANDCGDSDTAMTTVVVSDLSVGQINAAAAIRVYPNPAHGKTIVEAKGATITAIELMDPLGRTVLRTRPDAMQTTIDVQGLTAGMYLLRVQTDKGMETVKLEIR